MPLYLLHLLKPLNVAYFSPLKHVYNNGILVLACNYITYITKKDFLLAFKMAYNKAFIKNNIRIGFRGAKIVSLNPDVIILKLNIQLYTPTLPT